MYFGFSFWMLTKSQKLCRLSKLGSEEQDLRLKPVQIHKNSTNLIGTENPRRGRQARNFTTNVPKILDLKSSSEQIFCNIDIGYPREIHSHRTNLHA